MADEELKRTQGFERRQRSRDAIVEATAAKKCAGLLPIRIEALRAASRIVGGMLSTGPAVRSADGMHDVEDNALEFAEQFALWLETGER